MMDTYIPTIAGGAIILLLVTALIVSHARMLLKMVNSEWENLRDLLSQRHDYLPDLMETARRLTTGTEEIVNQVIKARERAEHSHIVGLEKVESEMNLSKAVNEMMGLTNEFPALKRDTNFLELRNDLKEVGVKIEKHTLKYNSAVRRLNRFVLFPPFRLICAPFGVSRAQIFEFE